MFGASAAGSRLLWYLVPSCGEEELDLETVLSTCQNTGMQ